LGWEVTAIDQSKTGKNHCLQKAEKLGLQVELNNIIYLNEGTGHVGQAHVIRLIGEKIKI